MEFIECKVLKYCVSRMLVTYQKNGMEDIKNTTRRNGSEYPVEQS